MSEQVLKLKYNSLFFPSSLLYHISNPKLPCRRRSRKCTPVCDQVRPSNKKTENFPSLIFQKKTCPIQYLKRKQSDLSKNKIARATFSIRSSPPARPPTSAQSTGQQLSVIVSNCQQYSAIVNICQLQLKSRRKNCPHFLD